MGYASPVLIVVLLVHEVTKLIQGDSYMGDRKLTSLVLPL